MLRHQVSCIIVGLLSAALIISCSTGQAKPIALSITSSISAMPDSSYFSDLRQLQSDENNVYALDINRREVLSISKDFSIGRTYGQGGRGPGELVMPFSFIIDSAGISIIDFADYSINRYDMTGCHIQESSTLPRDVSDQRFASSGDSLFLPVKSSVALFLSTDFLPAPESRFTLVGTPQPIGGEIRTALMNNSHIFYYNGSVYCVPLSLPFIIIEDNKGERRLDLSACSNYNKSMRYIKDHMPANEKQVYVLNEDAFFLYPYIYILFPVYSPAFECNRIMKINLLDEKDNTEYKLSGNCYSTFCVDSSAIYAYNTQGAIEKYLLIK